MSQSKKFDPDKIGFYALFIAVGIILVLIVFQLALALVGWFSGVIDKNAAGEGTLSKYNGSFIKYDNITNSQSETTCGRYGDHEYYVIVVDVDDDQNLENVTEEEETKILELLDIAANDENNDLDVYILDKSDEDNKDIIASDTDTVKYSINLEDDTEYTVDEDEYKTIKVEDEPSVIKVRGSTCDTIEIYDSSTPITHIDKIDDLIEAHKDHLPEEEAA